MEQFLELFARRELPSGWEGFGDQVGKFKAEPIDRFHNPQPGDRECVEAAA